MPIACVKPRTCCRRRAPIRIELPRIARRPIRSARFLASRDRSLVDREGVDGLDRLPHVGRGIATAIIEMVRTGHWSQLERLRGTADPVALFTVVPGLGHRLAERIHEELHLDTLEGLELAAHDGRLENVPGVGPRRAAAIRANLHAMLVRGRDIGRAAGVQGPVPGVGVLLAIDRQYREQATAGTLSTIAPIRFNPAHEVLAARAARGARRLAVHRAVFQHGPGASAEAHARLGADLPLRLGELRGPAHRRHRDARTARGQARGTRPRGGVSRALRLKRATPFNAAMI